MRPGTLTALAAVGLAVAAPVALAGQQSTTIGTGTKTCVLGPGADCRGVVHRWTVEHHGNLRKAKFTRADLRGANLPWGRPSRSGLPWGEVEACRPAGGEPQGRAVPCAAQGTKAGEPDALLRAELPGR